MVDLHTHILPEVDDGAVSPADSLAMARVAYADGVDTMVATPHFRSGARLNDRQSVVERTEALREHLAREQVELQVLPGGEVPLLPDLLTHLREGRLPTLGNNCTWVLLEMPFGALPARLPDLLAGLASAGLRILVAHPERCAAFQRDPCLLDRFFAVDVPLQVTAGSLMGRFGPAARKCALQMVRTPHPIVVASDAHDPLLRAPVLSEAVEVLEPLIGEAPARHTVDALPRALLSDGDAWRPPDEPQKRRWWGRLTP